jgi:hypothetical protein
VIGTINTAIFKFCFLVHNESMRCYNRHIETNN